MPTVTLTRRGFRDDARSWMSSINRIDAVLEFFNDEERQQRVANSEIHHDRPALAGVVRELEANPEIHRFLGEISFQKSKRLRQAIGVVVRIIMEARGWRKTGRKGSLGVAAPRKSSQPGHNTGGLALWFIRAERYELNSGTPYRSVRDRCRELDTNSELESSEGE